MSTADYYLEKDASYYALVRYDVIGMIPRGVRRMLDIGCSNGATSAVAKEQLGIEETVGVEPFASSAALAAGHMDRVINADIEVLEDLGFPEGYFDCIICADVLEHLRDPWAVLRFLRRYLSDDGCLIASIPNIQHIVPLLKMARNRFEYEEHGILDRTHLRFFTLHTMIRMFNDSGFAVEMVESNRSNSLPYRLATIASLGLFRPFTVFQYRLRCRKA
ncbi:MAG: class I SAM-dependent methyltransferase [Bacteroidetes bacterium]|nr:class I SAM-dependent methyltransferase [Bacteroidota bacterium]